MFSIRNFFKFNAKNTNFGKILFCKNRHFKISKKKKTNRKFKLERNEFINDIRISFGFFLNLRLWSTRIQNILNRKLALLKYETNWIKIVLHWGASIIF